MTLKSRRFYMLMAYLAGSFPNGRPRVIPVPPPPGVAGDCLLWEGAKSVSGDGRHYAKAKVEGKTGHLRTAICCANYGWADITGYAGVVAVCDQPLCCNPDHLKPGVRPEARLVAS
jgi:hypothetical protein